MCGEQLGTLAVKLYLLVIPDVYLGEVITVEVSVTQDISAGENLLFLEFRLGPKHEPGFVEFLLLGSQGFRLRLVVGLQGGYIVIQFAYLLTFAYEFLVLRPDWPPVPVSAVPAALFGFAGWQWSSATCRP